MKAKETYLKGKSIFIVSLIVIVVTILTVYLSGINYNRTITSNLYLSLGVIGTCLFIFMSYGLYKGFGLIDNFPKYNDFKSGDLFSSPGDFLDIPSVDVSDGVEETVVAIILWIVMTIFFSVILIMLGAVFWFSLLMILTMLYWVFFRALKLVFNKVNETRGNIEKSMMYSLAYTVLFTGWIFGIAYIVELFK